MNAKKGNYCIRIALGGKHTNVKAITNIDGNFQIDGLDKEKTYTRYINYIGYKTQKIDGVQAKDADQVIALQPDDHQSYTLC